MTAEDRLSDRALNRALLARQGLLERRDAPLVDVLESIGAMQGQAWAALPVGLWSRMASFAPADLYAALERGDVLWGIGLRGTLHLVSAREHPAYATVAAPTTAGWARKLKQTTPGMDALRAALLAFAATRTRTNEEIREFVEEWVGDHPEAVEAEEVEAQRALKWRPIYRWSSLVRASADGSWGARTPSDHRAAPIPPGGKGSPSEDEALVAVARAHLQAFGPAAAEDVATWIGHRTPAVRRLLDGLDLETCGDEHGRTLYDLPGAPRPDPGTDAPARLLGAFDSSLLAYVAKRRDRIVPSNLRDVVYERANLQVKPSFLVDGFVAGTWAVAAKRREASLTLSPGGRLAKPARAALTEEATRLLQDVFPEAKGHAVEVAR